MESELSSKLLNDLVSDNVEETRAKYGSNESAFQGFRDLRVWQVGMDLVAKCYQIADSFPSKEQFGLTNQLRRASISIVLNIAEGWGRNGKTEFARFTDIAFGSLTETEACLDIAVKLGYKEDLELVEVRNNTDQLARMLHKLRTNLRK